MLPIPRNAGVLNTDTSTDMLFIFVGLKAQVLARATRQCLEDSLLVNCLGTAAIWPTYEVRGTETVTTFSSDKTTSVQRKCNFFAVHYWRRFPSAQLPEFWNLWCFIPNVVHRMGIIFHDVDVDDGRWSMHLEHREL